MATASVYIYILALGPDSICIHMALGPFGPQIENVSDVKMDHIVKLI